MTWNQTWSRFFPSNTRLPCWACFGLCRVPGERLPADQAGQAGAAGVHLRARALPHAGGWGGWVSSVGGVEGGARGSGTGRGVWRAAGWAWVTRAWQLASCNAPFPAAAHLDHPSPPLHCRRSSAPSMAAAAWCSRTPRRQRAPPPPWTWTWRRCWETCPTRPSSGCRVGRGARWRRCGGGGSVPQLLVLAGRAGVPLPRPPENARQDLQVRQEEGGATEAGREAAGRTVPLAFPLLLPAHAFPRAPARHPTPCRFERRVEPTSAVSLPAGTTTAAALDRVLRLPSVCSKRFLTTKVRRAVVLVWCGWCWWWVGGWVWVVLVLVRVCV